MQLERQIREHISKYYLGWTVCDDSTCGNKTRMMSVYGKRCLRQECTGRVTFEVGVNDPVHELVAQRIASVLGYAAVQSAQVLRLSI